MRTNSILFSRLFACAGMLLLLFALVAALPTLAQDASPTPAPTKTATAPASEAEAATEQPEPQSAAFEPLRQDDLQLLTGNVQRPNGLTYFNGYLYTACSGDGTVYEIHSETGVTRTYIWGVSNAHSLYVEEVDDVLQMWVPDYGENRLERVTRQGVTAVTSQTLQGPWGIVKEDDEHFLVSSLLGNVVSRITREGEVTPALEGLAAPAGLALDGDVLYVANNGSTRRAVEWYDLSTEGDGGPLISGLQNTTGLFLADDGYLYLAYSLGTRGLVGRVDPQMCLEAGGCTNDQVEVVVFTDLETPLAGLTVTPDGRLFLHTMYNPALYWVQIPDWPAAQ